MRRRLLRVAMPYLAVGTGLYLLRSAWIAFLGYHALMAAALLRDRHRVGRLRLFGGWNGRAGTWMALLALSNGPAFLLLWRIAAANPDGLSARLGEFGLSGSSLLWFSLWYCTVHPLLEEMYWRGLLRNESRSVALEDLAFAGYHLLVLPLFLKPLWAILAFAVLAAVAWFWRVLARKYEGLAVPAVSHAAAGLGTMGAVFALARIF